MFIFMLGIVIGGITDVIIGVVLSNESRNE